jgi:excisionase family DNA binding protein
MGDIMDEWITVKETAKLRKCTDRTVLRWIEHGEIEAKRDGHRWLILKSSLMSDESPTESEIMSLLKAQLEDLRAELEDAKQQIKEKDETLRRKDEQLAEASHRHDTVVMQMTRLLEYHQQPFWRKLFSRKALPPPVEGNVVNMETQEDKEKNGK